MPDKYSCNIIETDISVIFLLKMPYIITQQIFSLSWYNSQNSSSDATYAYQFSRLDETIKESNQVNVKVPGIEV